MRVARPTTMTSTLINTSILTLPKQTVPVNIEKLIRALTADFSIHETVCDMIDLSMFEILSLSECPMDCRARPGEQSLVWQAIEHYIHCINANNYDQVVKICSLRPLGALNLLMPIVIKTALDAFTNVYLLQLLCVLLEIYPDRQIINSGIEQLFSNTSLHEYKLDVMQILMKYRDGTIYNLPK